MEIRKNRWAPLELAVLVKLKFPLTSNTFVASRVQFVLGNNRLVEASTKLVAPGTPLVACKIKFPPLRTMLAIFGCKFVETTESTPLAGSKRQRRPPLNCGVRLLKFPLALVELKMGKLWPGARVPARLLNIKVPP